ncbi:flagellar biosynthetic protein FliO [Diaminobutyricimonas sp. TR449]|uniref:FliO/MopB family protein n=1 Tax=Diaminobutyricimonas sp. TR449 TaxID=2708076 RepID=UPI00141E2E4F|nr:flagellar biosynthetic protein FliO [Diaminobutyricimonas sp. TR449]
METLELTLRVVLALAVVFGLLWVVQRKVAGSKRTQPVAPIQVLGRQRVSPKASVVLIEADGKRFVLGVTDQAVTVVHAETTSATPVELGSDSPADAFARSMRTVTDVPAPAPAEDDAPLLRPRRTRATSPMAGSILSPATWRQTRDAFRSHR